MNNLPLPPQARGPEASGNQMAEVSASLDITCVVFAGSQRARVERALHSLISQLDTERSEILLFDFCANQAPSIAGTEHPAVRIIEKAQLEPFGRLRAEAVQLAHGEIVAFLEEHCVAMPGWVEAVIDAHAEGWDGIGPEVHTGNPGVGISNAIAVMNYARWFPPASRGESDLLVGNNSSYRKSVLLKWRDELGQLMACDPILQWKLSEAGHRLAIEPKVRIIHWNETEYKAIIRGYYLWNRIFAPLRAKIYRWSQLQTITRLILLPAVPFVRTIKTGWLALRRNPPLHREFLSAITVLLAAQTAAAFGQAVGWIFGPGNSEIDFLEYELEQERPVGSGESQAKAHT